MLGGDDLLINRTAAAAWYMGDGGECGKRVTASGVSLMGPTWCRDLP